MDGPKTKVPLMLLVVFFGADDECDVNHGWDGYVRDGIAATMLMLKTI